MMPRGAKSAKVTQNGEEREVIDLSTPDFDAMMHAPAEGQMRLFEHTALSFIRLTVPTLVFGRLDRQLPYTTMFRDQWSVLHTQACENELEEVHRVQRGMTAEFDTAYFETVSISVFYLRITNVSGEEIVSHCFTDEYANCLNGSRMCVHPQMSHDLATMLQNDCGWTEEEASADFLHGVQQDFIFRMFRQGIQEGHLPQCDAKYYVDKLIEVMKEQGADSDTNPRSAGNGLLVRLVGAPEMRNLLRVVLCKDESLMTTQDGWSWPTNGYAADSTFPLM